MTYSEFKNAFGWAACRYEPTSDGLVRLMADPEFKRLFPDARHGYTPGTINFEGSSNGWGDVDVLQPSLSTAFAQAGITIEACSACGSRQVAQHSGRWQCCHCGAARVFA